MSIPQMTFHLCGEDDPIGDPARFIDWLTRTIARGERIAIDTETTGLDWDQPHFVRLVQFGTADEGWAVPVEWYGRVAHHALALIREAGVPVVMHNAKFDMHAITSAGLPVPDWANVHDTMILHHLSDSSARHGLKAAAAVAFGPWAKAGQDELKREMRRNGWDWATVPVDLPSYWAYGVMDTCLTARLFDLLLVMAASPAYEREMAYQAIMFRAERRGMRIDVDYASALKAEWEERRTDLQLVLWEAGITNPNSNRMVEAALADLGWSADEWTDTGQARLDAPVLKRIMDLGGPTGAVAEALVEWKRLGKWTATYLDPFIQSGGVVHPSINTMAARTGRSSITNPPLQTLPHTPHIRRAVVPRDGHVLWSIDYAGQEARIFASLCNDPAMVGEFLTGGGDLHSLVARLVFGDGFTHEQRSIAKTVNFALLYGAGPKKMAMSAGVTEHEMKTFLALYHRTFPGVALFMKDTQDLVMARWREEGVGYVKTRGGRRVVVDEGKAYAGVNYLIQGSGADVLKEAVVDLACVGLEENIVIPVHDELLFDFPAAEAEEMAAEAQRVMTNESWFRVPITTDGKGPLPNWGRAYEKE